MHLTMIFDDWLIDDGRPTFVRDELVSVAFRVTPEIVRFSPAQPAKIEARNDATCSLIGAVSWLDLEGAGDTPIAVLDAGIFRGYVEDPQVQDWKLRATAIVEAEIHVDYYVWEECIASQHPGAPEIFYPFRVSRIRQCLVYKPSIVHTTDLSGSPIEVTRLSSSVTREVETMINNEPSFEGLSREDIGSAGYGLGSFFVDLSDDDLPERGTPASFPHHAARR